MAKKRGKARKRGALGALQTDVAAGATHRASDLNMVGRAIREEWPIPHSKRPAVISRLLKNVEKGDIDQSSKAAMVLTNMSRVNQADRHHTEKLAMDEKGQAVDLFKWAAGLPDDQLIKMAMDLGHVDKLPPRLRMIAERTQPKEGPP